MVHRHSRFPGYCFLGSGRIAGLGRSVCLGGVSISCAVHAQGTSTKWKGTYVVGKKATD